LTTYQIKNRAPRRGRRQTTTWLMAEVGEVPTRGGPVAVKTKRKSVGFERRPKSKYRKVSLTKQSANQKGGIRPAGNIRKKEIQNNGGRKTKTQRK